MRVDALGGAEIVAFGDQKSQAVCGEAFKGQNVGGVDCHLAPAPL
jgi:hypothetical protein